MANLKSGLRNSWTSGSLWGMTGYEHVVTFIGAGGKTTCLQSITQEVNSAGHQVVATTTTKVFPDNTMNGWKNQNPPPKEQKDACFWYVDVQEENGKWVGPPLKAVDDAIEEDHGNHFWVIEGDGARGLKLKCWDTDEPQIPQRTNCVVLVIDGILWKKVLQVEQVHRPSDCLDLIGHVWNAEKAWRYFLRSPVFDPQYGQMSWVIFLNTRASMNPYTSLIDLNCKWEEIQREVKELEYRPKHLRLASGDAKEGKLHWFDLW